VPGGSPSAAIESTAPGLSQEMKSKRLFRETHNDLLEMKQFRVNVWDPALLIAQICALQGLFYVVLGSVCFLLARAVQAQVSLDLLFSTKVRI
jgi:hypothetical protein